jgi:exosome complex RNA-binding protein Rrp42 (RNase PH superfamily)
MGRILTITNSRDTSIGIKKRAIKKELTIGSTTIKFVSIAIFAVLALVYLTQSTAGANRSLEVRDLTNKTSDLQLRKEQLEVEKARLNSLNQIDASIEKPSLTPVTAVDHLNEANRTVALR